MRFPWWGRRRREAELEDEIQSHLQMAARDRVERGESPADAERSIRREFGGVDLVKDVTRDMWGWRWLEDARQDVRYGARALVKSPGFTAIAILTLALGIGANTAIFSVVDAVLFRPLPYREPDRLVTVSESNTANDLASRNDAAPGNFLDWRKQNHVFLQMAAVELPGFSLTGTDRAERVLGAAVSGGTLGMLGLQPQLGREISAEDDRPNANPVVMLSDSLWRRNFGATRGILGMTIRLDAKPYTVIGVLPAALQFPQRDVDVWVPLEHEVTPENMRWRNSHYLGVYARLKPGVTLQQAREDMNRVAALLRRTYPDSNSGAGAAVLPLQDDLVSNIRSALLTLLVAVGFVLLIACANVANLLLVRATGREREMAIRLSLGAGGSRLAQQVLTESLLLSLAGGAAGLLVAGWSRHALLALRPASLPLYNSIGTDNRVLLFSLGLSVATGVLFGLVPALRATRSDLNFVLRGTSRNATAGAGVYRLRNVFVAGQVAISLVLLAGAGLLIRGFVRLRNNDVGIRTDHTLTMRISIPREPYTEDGQVVTFCDRLLEKIRAIQGVDSAGAVSFLPLTGARYNNSFDIVGRPPHPPSQGEYALVRFVDPQYFGVLGIPLHRGRGIADRDRAGMPRAVVISESLARHDWPDSNPIGEHLKVYMGMDQSPWEIVGVVGDVRTTISAEPEPMIYFPYAQMPYRYMVLAVRTHGDPKALAETIRSAARTIDPDQPFYQVRTLEELLAQTLVPWRFSMTLLGAFAGLALVLSSAGIYGVISYAVGQRTSEIGIRMALGAQPGSILRLILLQGTGVLFAGIVVGLAGASYLTRFLTAQLYGVGATDALTFGAITVLFVLVALGASYIPARRASRIDPMVALRYE